jgi:hypothetical protein
MLTPNKILIFASWNCNRLNYEKKKPPHLPLIRDITTAMLAVVIGMKFALASSGGGAAMKKILADESADSSRAKLLREKPDMENHSNRHDEELQSDTTVAELYGCICHRPVKDYRIVATPTVERRRSSG